MRIGLTNGMIAATVVGCLVAQCQVHAAELRVTTEYIYPTRYEIRGGQMVVGPNGAVVMQDPVVIPTEFATREVGVIMSVEALLSPLDSGTITITSLEQKNRNGNTELMLAATSGDLDKVRQLLQKGAIVNARNYYGSSALMGAAAGGFGDVAKLLLLKGANPNSKSNTGSTPLMFAAKNGHLAVVKLLLQSGAKVNDTDNEGLTPLMFAVGGGHKDVVTQLMASGARLDTRDRHGTTPARLAEVRKDDDILVLLTRGGNRK